MAVTVEQEPFVVLDHQYRIVEVGQSAEGGFGPLVGLNLWECFPESEGLFRPYYERAWRTGEADEFMQFYSGRVARIRAEPRGEHLALWWDVIHVIDPLTVEDLQASIERTIELVDDEQAEMLRRDTRGSLRLIEGGA